MQHKEIHLLGTLPDWKGHDELAALTLFTFCLDSSIVPIYYFSANG
jgi:hypothetical protein